MTQRAPLRICRAGDGDVIGDRIEELRIRIGDGNTVVADQGVACELSGVTGGRSRQQRLTVERERRALQTDRRGCRRAYEDPERGNRVGPGRGGTEACR